MCRAARWYDVLVEVKYDATRLERIFCRASNGPDLLIRDIIRHVIVYLVLLIAYANSIFRSGAALQMDNLWKVPMV